MSTYRGENGSESERQESDGEESDGEHDERLASLKSPRGGRGKDLVGCSEEDDSLSAPNEEVDNNDDNDHPESTPTPTQLNLEQKMAMAKTETGYIGVYREGLYFATGAYVKNKWVPLGIHRTVKMAAFVREFYVHRHNLYGTALNWSNKNWGRVMRMKPMKIKKRKRRRGGSDM